MEEPRGSRGIGSFFFAAIPWILGCAALVWLAFFSSLFSFSHDATTLNRMDNRVGVFKALKTPVKLTIDKRGCVQVDRAFLDGDTVTMYIKSHCAVHQMYFEWHWKTKAPDGTVIGSQYTNTLDGIEPGDTVEKTMDIDHDRRTVEVVVWATERNN